MKYLSLRVQIFMLVALAVVAVAASSFRSTWSFLLQDKLASLRELQTLTLVSSLQDLRSQSQNLREELRSIAVELYRNPDQVGQTFENIKSSKGNYVWKKIRLYQDPSYAVHTEANSKKSNFTSNLAASLLLDPEEIVDNGRAPANISEPLAEEAPIKKWSFKINKEQNGMILEIEDPLKLGQDKNHYILSANISTDVISNLIDKNQFQSIDVKIYAQDSNNSTISSINNIESSSSAVQDAIQKEINSETSNNIEGRSISLENENELSYISFSKLKLSEGTSNIIIAFISQESLLVKEFQAFLAEQAFMLISILFGALLAGYLITRLITKPVSTLVEATRELERGNFNKRVDVNSYNEIGRLASAFNNLGSTLQQRENALANAERNMRQLSFQTEVFKRLTDFSEKISKILDPDELSEEIIRSWSQLLNISTSHNTISFYKFDDLKNSFQLKARDSNFKGPKILNASFWNDSIKLNFENFEVTDAEVISQYSINVNQSLLYRIPILGDNKIHGVLVFTAVEIQSSEYFELLVIECQRLLSSSFEAAHRYATLRETSIRDGLTGLFNVRFFKECLEREIIKAKEVGNKVSFLFFDVDHFKNYNDTNGHPAGDKVLKQIASIMRATFDSKDVIARYGGEEFVVLLKNATHEEALMHAERLRATIEEAPFEFEHKQPLGKVTVSIGVSTFPEHAVDTTSLIKIADDALYKAKKTSRNLVVSANAVIAASGENAA